MKKRIEYIDALKGFSVLWVVLYHFNLSSDFVNAPLRLPVFFLISGFFFRQRNCFKDFLIKKVNTLLIPFLFFWVFGIGMRFITSTLDYIIHGEFDFSIKLYLRGFLKLFTIIPLDSTNGNPLEIGAIWFLIGLFCLQMIYYGLLKISENIYLLTSIALGCFFLSFYLTENICAFGSLLYIPYVLRYLIFYILGHKLFGKFLSHIQSPRNKITYLASLIPVFIGTLYINNLIESRGCNISHVFTLIQTLLFTGIITIIFSYIHKWKFCKIFSYFGKNSIVIFGSHMAIMPFITIPAAMLLHCQPNTWSAVAFEYPCLVIVCYILTELLIKYWPSCIGRKDVINYRCSSTPL